MDPTHSWGAKRRGYEEGTDVEGTTKQYHHSERNKTPLELWESTKETRLAERGVLWANMERSSTYERSESYNIPSERSEDRSGRVSEANPFFHDGGSGENPPQTNNKNLWKGVALSWVWAKPSGRSGVSGRSPAYYSQLGSKNESQLWVIRGL